MFLQSMMVTAERIQLTLTQLMLRSYEWFVKEEENERTYQLLSTDGFIFMVSVNSLVSAGLVVSGTFLYPS